MAEALAAAEKIAAMSRPAAAMAKEAINRAFETPLAEGMNARRNLFRPSARPRRRDQGAIGAFRQRRGLIEAEPRQAFNVASIRGARYPFPQQPRQS